MQSPFVDDYRGTVVQVFTPTDGVVNMSYGEPGRWGISTLTNKVSFLNTRSCPSGLSNPDGCLGSEYCCSGPFNPVSNDQVTVLSGLFMPMFPIPRPTEAVQGLLLQRSRPERGSYVAMAYGS